MKAMTNWSPGVQIKCSAFENGRFGWFVCLFLSKEYVKNSHANHIL